MRLTPGQIAWLVARAGWQGDDRADAVAVALAESAGQTEAHAYGPAWGGHDYRGLWQVPVDLFPSLARADLFDAGVNAAVAFNLWRAYGGQFSWAGSWAGAYFHRFLEVAVGAMVAPSPVAPMPEVDPARVGGALDAAIAALGREVAGRLGSPIDLPPGDHLTHRL